MLADEIDKVLNALRQLQFAVQGLSGEGRTVRGALFRIGQPDHPRPRRGRDRRGLRAHVGKVIIYERPARELLLGRDPRGLEDLVYRGLATLRRPA